MRTAGTRKRKATKAPTDCRTSQSCNGANKGKSGQNNINITGDGTSIELMDTGSYLSGTLKESPTIVPNPGQAFLPHKKITLHLFPMDKDTRMRLKKEGHNPYLQLILRAGDKIPSVLKHLSKKWGSSKVAFGEPMLFPFIAFNMQVGISGCKKWTVNDIDISVEDIFASIGRPATFRLRYGWSSNSDPKPSDEPSTPYNACLQSEGAQADSSFDTPSTPPTPYNACLHSEGAQTDSSFDTKKTDKGGITHVVNSENFKSVMDDEQGVDSKSGESAAEWFDGLTDISIGGLLSEASLQAKLNDTGVKSTGKDTGFQPTQLNSYWKSLALVDSLTNISIGGLLSEASLQGKFNNNDVDVNNITIGSLLSEASLRGKFNNNDVDLTNISIGGLLSEPSLQGNFNNNDVSLASISIGGLLSEASLQGKFNNKDGKSTGGNADLQASQIIPDSLDAFISSQRNHPECPRPPISSILDAEDTCHAFPLQKHFSSGKRISAIGGSSGGCSQSTGFESFRCSKKAKISNCPPGVQDDQLCQESQAELLLCSGENSLGLRSINWSDSLGAFDLEHPASRKFISGESKHQ